MRLPLPAWMLRVLRLALVAVAAYLAFHLLEPRGYGWTVLLGAGLLAAGWVGLRAWRVSRVRAEDARADAWAEALMRPERRPDAIRELEAELEAIDPTRRAEDHARLTLVLAELLEADGRPGAAAEALARVRLGALDEVLGAVIHHARAVAALSAGDPAAAEAALDEVLGPSGDRAVDRRLRLLRGAVAVERGDPAAGLAIAEDVLDEVGSDRELATEARVLRAMAQDASGDHDGAIATMRRLGDEMLEVLAVLGLPRVRTLADEALADART